ncbi:hypothetical protein BSL78_16706 [Apostichopus japonicus]|uniref:Uncharacterized protein n=1 Tax=Stichopus japonicus TaxID=307972 RepID=A0A2G8KEM5_STIJA|nr:hypothetical protein BSL78_16706 [Apostichopus japonicus]
MMILLKHLQTVESLSHLAKDIPQSRAPLVPRTNPCLPFPFHLSPCPPIKRVFFHRLIRRTSAWWAHYQTLARVTATNTVRTPSPPKKATTLLAVATGAGTLRGPSGRDSGPFVSEESSNLPNASSQTLPDSGEDDNDLTKKDPRLEQDLLDALRKFYESDDELSQSSSSNPCTIWTRREKEKRSKN